MKNFLKMNIFNSRFIKAMMINTIIFSLIQNPFINEASAAAAASNSKTINTISAITNTALGVMGAALNSKQQMAQMSMNIALQQKLMKQSGPACRRADGTPCFSTPAKYFPECTLPASMSNMPQNVCSNATPQPNQISSMLAYESLSNGWMNYYDQMSNEASNAQVPSGLRCLKDKEKAMDSQLTEMVNNLQRLQDQMNKDKQTFRDNNKKLLDDMNQANDELFGATKNNLDIKTQDFSKFFSKSCQSVIGKDNLKAGTASGLNGVLQGLSSTNKAASDFNSDSQKIQNDVQAKSTELKNSIMAGGVDDWLNNPNTQSNLKSTGFPGLETAVQKQAAEFNTARARITKSLAEVGYTPPAMDKNFSLDMESFNSGAQDFFQKKYVNDCVTGAEAGVAIPVKDILNSLKQESTGSAGTARNDYSVALESILNDQTSMMDAKMDRIKALSNQFKDITITYKDSSQMRVRETPYELFQKTIAKCQSKFSQDQTFASKGSSGISFQKKVERARASLQELKNLNDSFADKMQQAISNKILNCNGVEAKSGSESCNEDTLKPSNENFCISHASSCANNIQGCYAEANTQVQMRKDKMEKLAAKFNANVSDMIARSNGLYENQKAKVMEMTKLIQGKFPGTNFEIPKDMFVPMPEMSKDPYGVNMAAGGDIKSFLDGENSMPAKIDKLKIVFQKQRDAVKASIEEYIGLQKDAMTRERARWATLNTECKGSIDTSSKALAKMNEDGQKQQAQLDADTAKFCKKYNNISQNPIGGCGKAKDLATEADKIMSRLSNQAIALSEQYDSACDGYNNSNDDLPSRCDQADSDMKPADKSYCASKMNALAKKYNRSTAGVANKKSKKINFFSLCGDSGSNSDQDFNSAVGKNLSKTDNEKLSSKSTFENAYKATQDDNEEIDDNGFFAEIQSIVTSDKTSNSICKKLLNAGIADSTEEYDEKIKSAKAEIDSINETAKLANAAMISQGKDVTNAETAKNEKIVKLQKIVDENTKKSDKSKAFKELTQNLSQAQAPAQLDLEQLKMDKVTSIGEQMIGTCDAQNPSRINKGMGFDLQNFDQRILNGMNK